MRRVAKNGARVLACENDISLMRMDPPCPTFETVWRQFAEYQSRLGGDAYVGRRLHRLFRAAGFTRIELSVQPELHWHGSPGFAAWIRNVIGNVESAREGLVRNGVCQTNQINEAEWELETLIANADASSLLCGTERSASVDAIVEQATDLHERRPRLVCRQFNSFPPCTRRRDHRRGDILERSHHRRRGDAAARCQVDSKRQLPAEGIMGLGLDVVSLRGSILVCYVSLTIGTGALILFGSVQVTMMTAAVMFRERPSPAQWLGLALALAGLVYLRLSRSGRALTDRFGLHGAVGRGLGHLLSGRARCRRSIGTDDRKLRARRTAGDRRQRPPKFGHPRRTARADAGGFWSDYLRIGIRLS